MSVFHGIKCDGCGGDSKTYVGAARPSLDEVRAGLRMAGWLVLQFGGKDYCPQCVLRLQMKAPGREVVGLVAALKQIKAVQ